MLQKIGGSKEFKNSPFFFCDQLFAQPCCKFQPATFLRGSNVTVLHAVVDATYRDVESLALALRSTSYWWAMNLGGRHDAFYVGTRLLRVGAPKADDMHDNI